MNTRDNGSQRDETPEGAAPKPRTIRPFDFGQSGPIGENPWYSAPAYTDIGDLSDDEAAARMDHLKFQINILQEAAEFELDEPERGLLLVTISNYKIERDALGNDLRRRIVEGNLAEATERTRHYKNSCKTCRARINPPQRTSAPFASTDEKKSQKKGKLAKRMGGLTLVWDGTERRQGMPPTRETSARSNGNHKGKQGPRIIQIFLEY